MGIACLGVEGYEADDILGTIAKKCTDTGHQCVLYTGDRDSFQLIDDNVVVLFPQNGRNALIMDKDEIAKKYSGLVPAQLVDLKGLQGDKSDNIPGVPGIGEKTAINLIAQYGDIDKIYANIDSLDITAAVREKLKAGRESAFMSREIGTICKEVPDVSEIPVQDFVCCEANVEALREEFQLLGLQKFLSALEAGLAYTDSHAK
jgi:DNA polymerase-1